MQQVEKLFFPRVACSQWFLQLVSMLLQATNTSRSKMKTEA
jgi:hypothetical protein